MNLYLISQTENNKYDTFDSAVVVAESEEDARKINPDGENRWDYAYSSWCKTPDAVSVRLIGIAADHLKPGEIVLSSFNAG